MINWIFEVEGVTCTVDDMKITNCFVQRRRTKGRVNKGSCRSGLCDLIKDLMMMHVPWRVPISYLITNQGATDYRIDPTGSTTG